MKTKQNNSFLKSPIITNVVHYIRKTDRLREQTRLYLWVLCRQLAENCMCDATNVTPSRTETSDKHVLIMCVQCTFTHIYTWLICLYCARLWPLHMYRLRRWLEPHQKQICRLNRHVKSTSESGFLHSLLTPHPMKVYITLHFSFKKSCFKLSNINLNIPAFTFFVQLI